ncbi:hypothetical protein J2847_005796 [Azospirillum agricola]|uniref:hypothetical protein n=1 Tax=Azospirillum agricola TaxID=1720247 RepID=UPI001AE5009C|nr:hypothetical protein [Azospirillum agricola]MBP2232467.1 hypothetical protein [Azospirillum agricola]
MRADLERILSLAVTERRLRDHPNWKTAPEAAWEEHGEAVEALYAELYRQIDVRTANGEPLKVPPKPPAPRKELEKRVMAALKAELPGMVRSIIDAA